MDATTDANPRSSNTINRPNVHRRGLAAAAVGLVTLTACGSGTATTASGASITTAVSSVTPHTIDTTSVTSPSSNSIASSTTTAVTDPRPTATIDELIDVAGKRLHVRCVGQGATTVLLIAGFGGDASGWVKVEPAIAARARVCSYERPGTGTSDPATSTQTFSTQATELHTLLTTAGEPGPYVVVGHSFGGAEAIAFAAHFADEVTGLVLIDASPTAWPAAMCAVPDDGTRAAAMLRSLCTHAFTPAGNSEHLDVGAAFAEVSAITSLGSLPTAVVTATNREFPDGLAGSEAEHLTSVWNDGQRDWAALSTEARLVSVDHTGHHIEIDQPGVVIDEITRLLP